MSASGMLARLPLSMAGIALLLLVADATGSYAVAGAVDAAWILANAAFAPAVARLVDRNGQPQVVGPQLAAHLAGVTLILTLAAFDMPIWTWFAAAVAAGAVLPVVGSLVRARWAFLLAGSPLLRTAYSWESVVDEMVFVIGPVLVTFLVVASGPATTLALTIGIGAVGTVALLLQRRSAPPPQPRSAHRARGSVLRLRGMLGVVMVSCLLGVVFAGVEVTVLASARESGRTEEAGLVLSLWAATSMLAGLVLGAMEQRHELRRQLAVSTAAMVVLLLPLLWVADLRSVVVVLAAAGFTASPTLIASFALVESLVPVDRLTEALAWVSVGISVGFALGSPASGWLVDHVAPRSGFYVAVAAAVASALAVAASYRSLATGPGGTAPGRHAGPAA